MATLNASAWHRRLTTALQPVVGQQDREAQAIASALLAHYLRCDTVALLLDKPLHASAEVLAQLMDAVERLQRHEPLQYILGHVHFLGHKLQVNPAVLIPRPETQELVAHLLRVHSKQVGLSVLDACTGSGCIALSLALGLPKAQVWALELSAAALRVARSNAIRLGARVHWLQGDLLKAALPQQRWDIIVSNPPYVPQAEAARLHQRVRAYEPALALFVPDAMPLLFHKRLAELASSHLSTGGWLYAEVHEAFATQVASYWEQQGLVRVSVHEDMQGKPRWVAAQRP